jgi:L-lysine 2,3-aminomutase
MKNYSYKEFEKKYLYFAQEQEMFNVIKKILSGGSSDINKQRRIEKLLNVYLLNREESKIELNPF